MFWSIVLPSDQARSNYCCVQSGHSKPLPVTKQIETFSTPIAPHRPKREREFIRGVEIAVCVEKTLLKGIFFIYAFLHTGIQQGQQNQQTLDGALNCLRKLCKFNQC